MSTFDVIVIGEGVAGLTAAGQLAAAGLQVATFEQQIFGGLVLNVNELDPAPAGGEAGGAAFAAELIQSNGDAADDQTEAAKRCCARCRSRRRGSTRARDEPARRAAREGLRR